MRINFKQFKKVNETADRATLRDNRGHEITLSKKALKPHLLQSLSQLPLHLTDGGEAPLMDDSDSSPTLLRQPANVQQDVPQGQAQGLPMPAPGHSPDHPQSVAAQIGYFIGKHGVPTVMQAVHDSLAPYRAIGRGMSDLASGFNSGGDEALGMQPSPPVQPAQMLRGEVPGMPQQGQAPDQSQLQEKLPDAYKRFQGARGNVLAGIQGQAEVEGKLGQKTGEMEGQLAQQQQQAFDSYQNDLKDIRAERANLMKDVGNGHIDSNAYMHNLSTTQKIGVIIGSALSGIGAGLTGKDNLALQYLNGQINRDIEAQKVNLGQKKTLLEANFRREGDLNAAMTMTRINMNDIMMHKIQEEAGKSAYPLAKYKAQQMMGMFDKENMGLENQLLMQRQLNRQMNSSQMHDPETQLAAMRNNGMINDKDLETATKELQAAKNHSANIDNIMGAWDRANKENTVSGRTGHLGSTPASVNDFRVNIMPYLRDAEGKINHDELERTDELIPNPGDGAHKVNEKRQAIVNFLHSKSPVSPTLKRLGIDPEKFGRLNSQGKSRFNVGKAVGGE